MTAVSGTDTADWRTKPPAGGGFR